MAADNDCADLAERAGSNQHQNNCQRGKGRPRAIRTLTTSNGSMIYEDLLDEVTGRVERKAQGHAPMRIVMVCDGEGERSVLS